MIIFVFLRNRLADLKKKWIIEVVYPKKYPMMHLKSITNKRILQNSVALFIEPNVEIKNSKILIGKHTYIGNNTIIDSCNKIGSFCSISRDVKIGMKNHPLTYISTSPIFYSKYRKWVNNSLFDDSELKTVEIEDDVLISANVVIINGVKVGRGAIIAAGAVVVDDVMPYSIVGGVPAKVLKMRFDDETIESLEKSKWWLWDDEKLKSRLDLIKKPKEFVL